MNVTLYVIRAMHCHEFQALLVYCRVSGRYEARHIAHWGPGMVVYQVAIAVSKDTPGSTALVA